MAKNNVYITQKHQENLQKVADKKGVTKAAVLNEILLSVLGKDACKAVVLQIPSELLDGDFEGLENWLASRSAGILDHYYPEN